MVEIFCQRGLRGSTCGPPALLQAPLLSVVSSRLILSSLERCCTCVGGLRGSAAQDDGQVGATRCRLGLARDSAIVRPVGPAALRMRSPSWGRLIRAAPRHIRQGGLHLAGHVIFAAHQERSSRASRRAARHVSLGLPHRAQRAWPSPRRLYSHNGRRHEHRSSP